MIIRRLRPLTPVLAAALSVPAACLVLGAGGDAPVTPAKGGATGKPDQRSFGQSLISAEGVDVPAVYIIPMKGQMGTDIHGSIYEEVIEDLNSHKPDVIIFVLDSSDHPDLMVPQVEDPRETRGFLMIEEYRDLVYTLRDKLPDVRRAIWVKDSVGFSSLLALSWEELYMSPTARLSGLRRVIDTTGADKWSDPDVRAKMSAAWTAFVKSFLEYGDRGMEIADAMLWPEQKLSASFKGREVMWSPTDAGEFVVDSDVKNTVEFRAKSAEDLLISSGTVESLDDLLFLMGYREYRLVDGQGEKLVDAYIDQWRKAFDQTKEWYADYQQHRGWAGGDEALKWLGRAKRDLEQIISTMKRYKAVGFRWQTDMGISMDKLEVEVEKIREEIQALKDGRRGGGGGNRSGGGMSGGGGG